MSRILLSAPAAWLRGGAALQGLQLAAAVVLAFAASRLLGLPLGFWAVMSALIVLRANPDATLDAARDRVLGTVAGAACGLAGLWLFGTRLGAPAASLALVALVAFLSGGAAALRSAPIAALIVLGASGDANHTPLQVGLLRTAEIATGCGAGLAVAWAARHLRAHARPEAACARLLRQLDAQLALAPDAGTGEREAAAQTARAAARRLGEIVQGTRALRQRQLLQLALRLAQDVALLARLPRLREAPRSEADEDLVRHARRAIADCAAALEGGTLAAAREALAALQAPADAPWTVDAVAQLREDLAQLLRVAHAARDAL